MQALREALKAEKSAKDIAEAEKEQILHARQHSDHFIEGILAVNQALVVKAGMLHTPSALAPETGAVHCRTRTVTGNSKGRSMRRKGKSRKPYKSVVNACLDENHGNQEWGEVMGRVVDQVLSSNSQRTRTGTRVGGGEHAGKEEATTALEALYERIGFGILRDRSEYIPSYEGTATGRRKMPQAGSETDLKGGVKTGEESLGDLAGTSHGVSCAQEGLSSSSQIVLGNCCKEGGCQECVSSWGDMDEETPQVMAHLPPSPSSSMPRGYSFANSPLPPRVGIKERMSALDRGHLCKARERLEGLLEQLQGEHFKAERRYRNLLRK
ncbi:unnamed protein product, partial [Choristocarpus tenellus]